MQKRRPSSRNAKFGSGIESLERRCMLAAETILISEFMASNSSVLPDTFHEYSDWIEIYNASEEAVDLNGWFLTDDADRLDLWQFPEAQLAADKALVVRASGNDTRRDHEIHTNFRLSAAGEYLALVRPDKTIAHEFSASFPKQRSGISYGILFENASPNQQHLRYFSTPTPGEINTGGLLTSLGDVEMSISRGFYDEPFNVSLLTADPSAEIRYTTDGTQPTATHGIRYEAPIHIQGTTTLRAVSIGEGRLDGNVTTQSYIFLDDVLTQNGAGMPEEWGYYDENGPAHPARVPANYEVDPDVVDEHKDTIKDDLRSIPSLSIVIDPDDLWDLDNGIYMNPYPSGRGDAWERPASLELIDGDGETVFQQDAGLRIHGGWARRFSVNRKLSFRATFQTKYGEPSLDYPWFGEGGQQEFKEVVLRGGFNDQFRDGSTNATYMNDQWSRFAQLEAGGYAPRSNYVNLYLNGIYWGMYSPTERADAAWAASNFGGEPEEYDIINTGGQVVDGSATEWNQMVSQLSPSNFDYESIKQIVDVVDFADYVIVNQYIGNWDWPHNNWYASKRQGEGEKWRFHCWDAEAAFQQGISANRVDHELLDVPGPARLYLRLREVPEFQKLFANRLQKHLYGDGALSIPNNIERWHKLTNEIDRAIVGESARWGDGFRDTIHPITRDRWRSTVDTITRHHFPNRTDRLMRQYRSAGLFPSIEAPLYDPPGGESDGVTSVNLTVADGDIYVTSDGSDPLGADGEPHHKATRLNSVELVGRKDLGKLRPWQGETDNWTEPNFSDDAWADIGTRWGYDTNMLDDLIRAPNGFNVNAYQSKVRINSFTEVDQILAGEHVEKTVSFNTEHINFNETGRGGDFDNKLPFPLIDEEGNANNIVLDITGTIFVREAGTYTLGVTSNDAARLFLDGKLVYADSKRHFTRETLNVVGLEAGEHEVRLTMFERLGSAVIELYYAPESKFKIDDTFTLIGLNNHRPMAHLIDQDVSETLQGHASAQVRYPFLVDNLEKFNLVQLRVRHDAGLIAYLNGREVYRRNAPHDATADRATASLFDPQAVTVQRINLEGAVDTLRLGQNVFAVHVFNESADDFDMLLNVELVGGINHNPMELSRSTILKSRALVTDDWSALSVAKFTVATPATANNLRISEVHYHPSAPTETESAAGHDDGDNFEFIELVNISNQEIDLRNVELSRIETNEGREGVTFNFSHASIKTLHPGKRVLVVRNQEAFAARYGSDLPVAGEWDGGLNNAAETITLKSGTTTIHQFAYSDDWYPQTDGNRHSLERVEPTGNLADWSSSSGWRASFVPHGTPGRNQYPAGDANQDGVFNLEDLTFVFQAGEFEDGINDNSTWAEGDWDGDGDFTTEDFVYAFRVGLFTP